MESAVEMLQRHRRDIDFYRARRDELLQQYPEQWVAILDQAVIASDADPWRLLATLEERGLPVERILFQHLTQHEVPLFL